MSENWPLGVLLSISLIGGASFVGMIMLIKIAHHLEGILAELRKR